MPTGRGAVACYQATTPSQLPCRIEGPFSGPPDCRGETGLAFQGGDPAYNASMLRELLSDYIDAPATDMLCLNAGAALLANERVSSLADGVQLARATLREGKARRKLADVVAATQSHVTVR